MRIDLLHADEVPPSRKTAWRCLARQTVQQPQVNRLTRAEIERGHLLHSWRRDKDHTDGRTGTAAVHPV